MRFRFRLLALLLFCLPWVNVSAGQTLIDLGRGPIVVEIPSSYDPARPLPLVIGLHGYQNTGPDHENYFQFAPYAESESFLYAYPTGTTDFFSNPFWNATDACCNLFGSSVNDVNYLLALVDEIRTQFSVDPWRVHFTGWSNGAFMSYRMSCDHADLVASMASLAGATYLDPLDCQPNGPVHTLEIHGTSDEVIAYGGGTVPLGGEFPGALQTVATWANYNQCDPTPDLTQPNLDLDSSIAGAESDQRVFDQDCTLGGSTRLWTIPGAVHNVVLSTDFRTGVVDFLLGHRKAGLHFDDGQTLVWPPLHWAVNYRVYRGAMADLIDIGGDGLVDANYGDCISATDPDATDTTFVDASLPIPGSGFFYLVGYADAGGSESMLGTVPNGAARLPATLCP